jgi:hypothetical protein
MRKARDVQDGSHGEAGGPRSSPFGSAAFLVVCALAGFLVWKLLAGLIGGPC